MMDTYDAEIYEYLTFIRGMFPDNIYVGGTYARNRLLLREHPESSDIDIFILGPRRMETWVLMKMLSNIFPKVWDHKIDREKTYSIPNQYKLIMASTHNNINFDLIFVNTDIDGLIHNTCSTISKIYYKLNYSPKLFSLCLESEKYIRKMLINNTCEIDKDLCSEKQHNKVIRFCVENNLDVKYI